MHSVEEHSADRECRYRTGSPRRIVRNRFGHFPSRSAHFDLFHIWLSDVDLLRLNSELLSSFDQDSTNDSPIYDTIEMTVRREREGH